MNDIKPSLRIAVLQTGRSMESALPRHGDYDEMCKTMLGLSADQANTYCVLDGIFPQDINQYDLFIITGSKYAVYERHAWIPPLEQLIREIYARGIKLIGVCFGHQIMAQALGGTAEKSDQGLGVGLMDYVLTGGEVVSLYAWHQDQVTRAPEGADVIASSNFCPIAGLRYGQQAISFQAHPEFSAEYERELLLERRGVTVDEDLADTGLLSLAQPNDNKHIQAMLIEFANA